jgi:diaminohydroxyphosphoribosylaminopyrimidine deaminase/5-amino-6-(5-phosphoribosylamino)uracil reductase
MDITKVDFDGRCVLPLGYTTVGCLQIYERPMDKLFEAWAGDRLNSEDARWMRLAFDVATTAAGVSSPNPAVGCVIVKHGRLVSLGATEEYGGLHAEAKAISLAKEDVAGSTAYVTLEPCSHLGKQGPCADALIKAGIKRCVIAMLDPNPLVNGTGMKRLISNGIEVELGVEEQLCRAFLAPFLKTISDREQLFVALKWAQTSDGRLARDDGSSQWISGPESRRFAHWLRHRYDAVVVGASTVIADLPKLTVRDLHATWMRRHPLRIVVDPHGKIADLPSQIRAKLLSSTFGPEAKTLYLSPRNIPAHSDDSFMATSARFSDLLQTAEFRNRASALLGRPLQSLMIEGGASLLSSILGAGIWDRCHIFQSEAEFGGRGVYALKYPAMFSSNRVMSKSQLGEDTVLELDRGD